MVIDPFATVVLRNSVGNGGWGYNGYSGVNVTRQDRFQSRERRRWGDWAYWTIAPPVLWLGSPVVLSPFDEAIYVEPAYIDIWAD